MTVNVLIYRSGLESRKVAVRVGFYLDFDVL